MGGGRPPRAGASACFFLWVGGERGKREGGVSLGGEMGGETRAGAEPKRAQKKKGGEKAARGCVSAPAEDRRAELGRRQSRESVGRNPTKEEAMSSSTTLVDCRARARVCVLSTAEK